MPRPATATGRTTCSARPGARRLIVDGKVYIGDEEGKVTVFQVGKEKEILSEINMGNSVYSTPVVANNVLYIANRSTLFCGQRGRQIGICAEAARESPA